MRFVVALLFSLTLLLVALAPSMSLASEPAEELVSMADDGAELDDDDGPRMSLDDDILHAPPSLFPPQPESLVWSMRAAIQEREGRTHPTPTPPPRSR